ncbi:MAG: L-threonylcarbamoyladenylate synthase [Pseudomonadota bacterium]|nr:L-threonylcarbamoyladenylate synthase [Pseudomonadota bacterium]
MVKYVSVHPLNPQLRRLEPAVEIMRAGGVVAYPTDSSYALGCAIGNKEAMERIRRIRQVDANHNFTLVCRDLSELSEYARVDNETYRLLKRFTPGPYTFILAATREVPRRLQHPKRRTIGLRVPDFPVVNLLLEELGEPLMSSTLILPGEVLPINDPEELREQLEYTVDAIVDSGPCDAEPTTVVDLTGSTPVVLRAGKGSAEAFT